MIQNKQNPLGRDPDQVIPKETAPHKLVDFVVIRLGDSLYAFNQDQVSFVAAVTSPLRIPTAPKYFLGVVHLRGRIIAVADLAFILGIENHTTESELEPRLLVLEANDQGFAVVADTIVGQFTIPDVNCESSTLSGVGSATFNHREITKGQFEHENGVVTILSATALVQGMARDRIHTD